jgi:hypothetical protein
MDLLGDLGTIDQLTSGMCAIGENDQLPRAESNCLFVCGARGVPLAHSDCVYHPKWSDTCKVHLVLDCVSFFSFFLYH